MADYKKMYLTLFNAVTDAINALQRAQQTAEETYISAEKPVITLLGNSDPDNGGEDSEPFPHNRSRPDRHDQCVSQRRAENCAAAPGITPSAGAKQT